MTRKYYLIGILLTAVALVAILMAYPHADIYLLADAAPCRVAYRDTEHYTVTRNFLTCTDRMLDILLREQEPDEMC